MATEWVIRFLVLFASIGGAVLFIPLAALLIRRYERPVLFVASALAGLVLVGGCVSLVAIGGNDAHLTIRNDTEWPVGISGLNLDRELVPPRESKEVFVPAGPGWIDGLIDDVVILAGPGRSTRFELHGINGLEHGTITINSETLAGEVGDRDVAAH